MSRTLSSAFESRSFIVSGAGSGIGRAIALDLARQGGRIVLQGRNRSKLEETRRVLPRADIHSIAVADLRDAEALRKALGEARITDGTLSAVIANAGVGGENAYGPDDRWNEIISTNLTGTYQLIHEALPALKASPVSPRNIVITSSILSRLGVPGYSAYCASKAGLLGLMRSLAVELAPEKILVNALCPGWVRTEMAEEGLVGIAARTGQSYEKTMEAEMGRVPLGKMSEPAEVAAMVKFLVSGEQTSITGQSLDFNNGAIMP